MENNLVEAAEQVLEEHKETFLSLAKVEEEEKIIQIENPSSPEDVLDTRSPLEIEADLLRKEEQAAIEAISKLPPEEIAGQFFQLVQPMFQARVHGLMAKGAKEVLDALIQYPLKNDKLVFSTRAAEEVFSLGLRLLDAKFIITQAAQMDEKIKVDKKSELGDNNSAVVQEVLDSVETSFKQGEEVNG